MPLPHESCDVRVSRPSSWSPVYVFNAAPCPHGTCVSPDSNWHAASDHVDVLPLNQHVPLGGHTPAPRPTSSSSFTALTIPPRMDVMFVRHRIATFMDTVIFLHRGALDSCFDFERRPPRSPSSDEGRERRLARRIRSWCRNEGSRIARCRRAREIKSKIQAVLDSRRAYQRVACNLTVFLVACFATMQYIILSYFSIDPTIVAVVSIAAVFWLVASPLQHCRLLYAPPIRGWGGPA